VVIGGVPLHFQYNPSAEERQVDAEEDRGVTQGTKLYISLQQEKEQVRGKKETEIIKKHLD
jgi:hypothetical protein